MKFSLGLWTYNHNPTEEQIEMFEFLLQEFKSVIKEATWVEKWNGNRTLVESAMKILDRDCECYSVNITRSNSYMGLIFTEMDWIIFLSSQNILIEKETILTWHAGPVTKTKTIFQISPNGKLYVTLLMPEGALEKAYEIS